MVKNSNGGKKSKGFARKSLSQDTFHDPKPIPPFEFNAVVTQMLGNSNCLVDLLDSNHVNLICHIRGKFRGRHKSNHIIHKNSRLIVGIRHWEHTIQNVDLLHLLGETADPPLHTPSLGLRGDETSDIVFGDDSLALLSDIQSRDEFLDSAIDSAIDDIVDIDDI
jgi:hypothetical protein